jgi:hypothetical protein
MEASTATTDPDDDVGRASLVYEALANVPLDQKKVYLQEDGEQTKKTSKKIEEGTATIFVKETPLPKAKVIPLMILLFTESFNSNSIFPYVAYMVYDFGITGDKREVGCCNLYPTLHLTLLLFLLCNAHSQLQSICRSYCFLLLPRSIP